MLTLRSSLLGIAVVFAVVALGGCQSPSSQYGALPTDLPADPEPCTKYCKVWVPPVYRDVPVLQLEKHGCTTEVPETVMEVRCREVCDRPACEYSVRTPGKRCEQAVVQTRGGGYKWKRDGDCWRYCYEEPCFQWCNKVVTEEGIEYCMEVPAQYHVDVAMEPTTRYRTVRQPAEYGVRWVQEVYRPGYWEWQPTKECEYCDCSAPCPSIPIRKSSCPPLSTHCPRTN